MPYVSPQGLVQSTVPTSLGIRPRSIAPVSDSAQPETPAPAPGKSIYTPSANLRQFNSRDSHPFLAHRLDHRTVWGTEYEVTGKKEENVDPLDEGVKEKITETASTKDIRPPKGRKLPMKIELPLSIFQEPSKRPVSVNKIEVDERFIPEDLL
ncbi:hypothetical protein E2P81_ATG11065 [Venturia nashicola]|nr:hypothetical protein E2P81_ATG11065 [Venturia nashicola]